MPRLFALVLALALGAAAPAAKAQMFLPGFDLGVTGGFNFASLEDAGSLDLDRSSGFHIGGYLGARFGALGARASVIYVEAGELQDATVFGTTNEGTLSWVAIPLDLSINATFPLIQPYLVVGPEIRIPTGEVFEAPGTREMALAANVGLGVRLVAPGPIAPEFSAEVRYGFDVTGFVSEQQQFGGAFTAEEDFKINQIYVRLSMGI